MRGDEWRGVEALSPLPSAVRMMYALPARDPDAPPRTLVFDFPLPENVGNRNWIHWGSKTQSRTAYFALLDTRVLVKWLPRAPQRAFQRAHAQIDVRTFRLSDQDNATARMKWPLDWLKTRGYLEDDSPAHLTFTLTPTVAPRHDCGITVRLVEVLG